MKTGPDEAAAGSNVAYTVTLFNVGPDPSAAVTLLDLIPAGMTFVSNTQDSGPAFLCSDPPVGMGGTISCTIGSMLNGESAQFTFVLQIPPATPPGTGFTNIATVACATDPNDENNSSPAFTSTPPPPLGDLSVGKNGPSSAGPDTDVTYTISVSNAGPDDAENVTLEDFLPSGLTFVSLVQDSGPAMACSGPLANTMTCTIAVFPAGATATFTLVVHVPSTPPGSQFTNEAKVSSTNDPTIENNEAQTTFFLSAVDVIASKSGPLTAPAGTDTLYTLAVSNGGPDAATGVSLSDTLPPGTTFVSLVQDFGPAPTSCATPPPGTTGTVTCNFTTLAFGATAQFSLVLNTGSASSIVNSASATTDSFDTNNGNNDSTVTTTVTQSADLVVTKNGPPTVTAGLNVTYVVTLTNNGPSDAANVILTDILPANTTFVSENQTSGPTFTCGAPPVGSPGTITCSIATLSAGASATFSFVFNVNASEPAGGSVSNTAGVASTTPDPDNSNDDATSAATVATSADLRVTKTGPAGADPDTDVTYTVTATNDGPSDAANVTLTDILPANTTFVSENQTSGPTFTCMTPLVGSPGTITCSIASLSAGASATFSFVVHLSAAAPSGSSVSNTAGVASTTPDPNNSNDDSTSALIVGASADLRVSKTGPATATSGTDVAYTVTVTNDGPSDAANVTLTDVLPANTTFVSATQTSGPTFNCTTPPVGSPGTITCTIATLTAGSSATFSFVVSVSASAPVGSSVSNTASVTSTTFDPDTGDGASTSAGTVGADADLRVSKTGPATAFPGIDVSYTVTTTNDGPSDAADVTLTDVVPANTTFVSATQNSGPTFNCTTPPVGSPGTITCTIADLPAGASATFTFVVNVDPFTTAPISNTASVASTTADPTPGNNSAATTATIADAAPAVPTLSPLALALLALCVAAAGLFLQRAS